jgi:hypothetical protein
MATRTKRYYGNQLQELLYPSATTDAKFDIQTAMAAVGQATASYVKINILQNKAFTRTVSGNWVAEYEGEVKWDEDKQRYFSDLPVSVISLPKDQGVYLVHYAGKPEEAFIPTSIGFLSSRRNNMSQRLEGKTGYVLVEDRLVYLQEMNTDCKLLMYLIPNHSDLDEDDYFPIDDSAITDIMKMAVELYQLQKGIPQDLQNDNISQ